MNILSLKSKDLPHEVLLEMVRRDGYKIKDIDADSRTSQIVLEPLKQKGYDANGLFKNSNTSNLGYD